MKLLVLFVHCRSVIPFCGGGMTLPSFEDADITWECIFEATLETAIASSEKNEGLVLFVQSRSERNHSPDEYLVVAAVMAPIRLAFEHSEGVRKHRDASFSV